MLKHEYRTRVGIYYDILKCFIEFYDAKISIISRYANLSHYAAMEKIEELATSGFLERCKIDIFKTALSKKKYYDWFTISNTGRELYLDIKKMNEKYSKIGGILIK